MDLISLGGDPDNHGHLLITSGGHRLGYVGGKFVDQIKGARVILPVLNQDWRAHPEPIYEVPAGTKLSVTLEGAGSASAEPATVHVTGPSFGATVSNLILGSRASAQLELAPTGSTIALRISGTGAGQAPVVQLARDYGRGGNTLVLTPHSLTSGTQIGLQTVGAHVRLTTSTPTQPIGLMVQTVSAAGSRSVQHSDVGLTPGRPTSFSITL
jgi:hypothetical protein